MKIYSAIALCTILFTACSSSSSTPDTSSTPNSSSTTDDTLTTDNMNIGTQDTIKTGLFLDSAVEGIAYATETQSGTTNAEGEFNYIAGEQVTFSIGATEFPAVTASDHVTPVDIAASSATPQAMVTNIARLLQSLDVDGNPDNGITIPAAASVSATALNFDVSTSEFENNPAVVTMVEDSGTGNGGLNTSEAALSHLSDTLAELPTEPESGVSTIDGIWLQTSQTDEVANSEKSRVQLTINGFDTGTATGRLWFEFYIGNDGNPCSTWRNISFNTDSGVFSVPEDGEAFDVAFTQPNGPNTLIVSSGGDTSVYRRLSKRLPAIAWDCSNTD